MSGNRYKIISGTGYEAELCFEWMKVKNFHNGKKARLRNFSIAFALDPNFEEERAHILRVVERYCKEFVPLTKNHFEVAEVAVRTRVPKMDAEQQKDGKNGKKKGKKPATENGEGE